MKNILKNIKISKTQEHHLKLIKSNRKNFHRIAKKHLTEDFLLTIIDKDRWATELFEEQSESFYIKALKVNAYVFQYFKLKNFTLCKLAVSLSSGNIEYVPKDILNYEIASIALTKKDEYMNESLLKFIPSNLIDYNLCLKAVNQYGENLEFVPDIFHTPELLQCSISQKPNAIKFTKKQSPELISICLENDEKYSSFEIENVKEKNYEFYLKAIALKKCKLNDVPLKFRTSEICLSAVKNNGEDLKHVPKQTEAICFEAVKSDPNSLEFCHYTSEKLILEALSRNGLIIKNIPCPTEEMLFTSINNDPDSLEYIPKELRTEKLCLTALRKSKDGSVLKYIEKEKQNLKMCIISLKKNEDNIQYVDMVQGSKEEKRTSLNKLIIKERISKAKISGHKETEISTHQ